MKIKTKKQILNLKGDPMKDEGGEELTIGKMISAVLVEHRAGGKMKMFILAQKFFQDDEVELDKADLKLVKDAIEKSEIGNNMVLGQILIALEDEQK